MDFRRLAQSASFACALIAGASPSLAEQRSVVELFTSQGCSSCPPADRLAGELARDPSLLVLTLPVDYWDYLGWKDTLALHGHSTRQKAYSETRGDRKVYTPQVVVNGAVHVDGGNRSLIDKAVTQTRDAAKLDVTLAVKNGDVTASIPAGTGSGEVWLCAVKRQASVSIGRGENNGKSVTYTNVVRRWVKLGDWNGKAQSFALPLAKAATSDTDLFAVMVQSGSTEKPGPVLGASLITR